MFLILLGCQLQEPAKNHGILFLDNRSEKLSINKSLSKTSHKDILSSQELKYDTSSIDELLLLLNDNINNSEEDKIIFNLKKFLKRET